MTGADNVTQNYRSHYQFIEDVTDAYIIGAFLDRFDMDNMTSKPSEIPVFSLMTDKEKVDWVTKAAVAVLDHLQLSKFDSLDELSENISSLDRDEFNINAMHNGEKFECAKTGFGNILRKSINGNFILLKRNPLQPTVP